MATKTFYPATVAQNSATWIAGFTSLNNIKVYNDDYAYSTVNGKSATKNTPAKITATNFNVSLPTGAKLNKITVQYKQRKTALDVFCPCSLHYFHMCVLHSGVPTRLRARSDGRLCGRSGRGDIAVHILYCAFRKTIAE